VLIRVYRSGVTVAAALAVVLAAAAPARAGLVFVSDRATLAGNDHVDWGTLGPPGTAVPMPHAVSSAGGLGVNLAAAINGAAVPSVQLGTLGASMPGTSIVNRQGGGSIFSGTFLSSGELRLTFAQPVFGAGADIFPGLQVLSNASLSLQVFDTGGGLIGQTGSALAPGSGGPRFVGVVSDTANIGSIVYRVQGVQGVSNWLVDLDMNQLDLVTATGPTPVPAPPAMALLGTAAVSLLGYGWRRKRVRLAL
jgi:hypothetical protein